MQSAVILDRAHLAAVAARGKDRESFLQNMLTNDVRSLVTGAGIPAAFLTVKGKLVSDLQVFKAKDAFLLEMERERVEIFRKALDRYIISEDVVLESLAEKEATFSIEGPEAARIVSAIAGFAKAELEDLAELQFRMGAHARVSARRRELTPRFDLTAPPDESRRLLQKALDQGAVEGGETLRETRRIEASRPRFGIDFDDSHLPLEAGLDSAISFQKGCYIGQEYVVRVAHRGHVNRKLSGLILGGGEPAAAGAAVHRGAEEAGTITSSVFSPSFGGVLALAYLKRGFWEPGTELSVGGASALVSPLPFAR
jgi:folate-binding protein YgfZ